jgi:hypothetical protein
METASNVIRIKFGTTDAFVQIDAKWFFRRPSQFSDVVSLS